MKPKNANLNYIAGLCISHPYLDGLCDDGLLEELRDLLLLLAKLDRDVVVLGRDGGEGEDAQGGGELEVSEEGDRVENLTIMVVS